MCTCKFAEVTLDQNLFPQHPIDLRSLAAGYLMVKLPSEILSFCLRYTSSSVGQHIRSWSKIRDSSKCSRIMTKSNWVSSSLYKNRFGKEIVKI